MEAREVKGKRRREKKKGERKRRGKRTRKKARVEASEGRSEPERKRASEEVCKPASEQANVWCTCGCEQCRQQVRHRSITNNTRV